MAAKRRKKRKKKAASGGKKIALRVSAALLRKFSAALAGLGKIAEGIHTGSDDKKLKAELLKKSKRRKRR
jgi:hypothetical protein